MPVILSFRTGASENLLWDVKIPGTKPHISPSHMSVLTSRLKALLGEEHSHFQPLVLKILSCVKEAEIHPPRESVPIHLASHARLISSERGVNTFSSLLFQIYNYNQHSSEFDPMDPEPFRRMVDDISKQLNLMVMMIRRLQTQKSYLNPGLSNCHITFEMPGTWGE